MIKKLDIMKDTRNVIDKGGIVHTVANFTAIEKINEIIEVVNALVYEHDKDSDWYDGQTRAENVAENGKCAKIAQEVDELVAILKRISESGLYVTDDGELHYAYCEPVKPDDSIIYKGGDNE